jgi:hypothetical protein
MDTYQKYYPTGPLITFSGMVTTQKILGGFSTTSNITSNVFGSSQYINNPNSILNTPGGPWSTGSPYPFQPHPLLHTPSGVNTPGIASAYKGHLYNREKFMEFVSKLVGKTLIFIDNGIEKIVDKNEALKFVFFHFLAAKMYKNWDDFVYKDDEWHLFFRQASTAPELLEAFDFTQGQVRKVLCL